MAFGHERISLQFVVFISSLTFLPLSSHSPPTLAFFQFFLTHVLGQYSVVPVLDCFSPDQPNGWLLLVITEVLTLMLGP